MKRSPLPVISIFLLSGCAISSGISDVSSSDSIDESEISLSSEEMHLEKLSWPIRQFASGAGRYDSMEMQYLFGDCQIPFDLFQGKLRSDDVLPGDFITWEFKTEALYKNAVLPPKYAPHGYQLVSVAKTDGAMVEIDVIDGVPQWNEAGVTPTDFYSRSGYQDDERCFDYAADENGTGIEVSSLSKVYAAVSPSEPTLAVALLTYPLRK